MQSWIETRPQKPLTDKELDRLWVDLVEHLRRLIVEGNGAVTVITSEEKGENLVSKFYIYSSYHFKSLKQLIDSKMIQQQAQAAAEAMQKWIDPSSSENH